MSRSSAHRRHVPFDAAASEPDGMVRVSLSLKVDAAEFADWPPQTIQAFFDGVARCIEAREYGRAAAQDGPA